MKPTDKQISYACYRLTPYVDRIASEDGKVDVSGIVLRDFLRGEQAKTVQAMIKWADLLDEGAEGERDYDQLKAVLNKIIRT